MYSILSTKVLAKSVIIFFLINLIKVTIVIGDFNIQYEDYKNDYKRKGSFHWSYNIFHQIKHNYNLVDGIKLYNDKKSVDDDLINKTSNIFLLKCLFF